MKHYLSKTRRVALDDTGATMVEYGLLIGLIAIAVMGAISEMSCAMERVFRSAGKPFE